MIQNIGWPCVYLFDEWLRLRIIVLQWNWKEYASRRNGQESYRMVNKIIWLKWCVIIILIRERWNKILNSELQHSANRFRHIAKKRSCFSCEQILNMTTTTQSFLQTSTRAGTTVSWSWKIHLFIWSYISDATSRENSHRQMS